MEFREAKGDDLMAIAALHAESWQRNYRGAFLDSFLDGDVFAERLAAWTDRLQSSKADENTVVADDDGAIVGFAHTIFDADPAWGALLDNLHVGHEFKRRGIGARLIGEAASAALRHRSSSGMYLWVLEQNIDARRFYEAQGGSCVERVLAGPFPGGGKAFSRRYAWLSSVLERIGGFTAAGRDFGPGSSAPRRLAGGGSAPG